MNRSGLKHLLARLDRRRAPEGLRVLIYHRVGGGTPDERDLTLADFEAQLDVLAGMPVVPLAAGVDALSAPDPDPAVVITFDDGFADVHAVAPLLVERRLPFTVYVATAYVGGEMHWEGSTASSGGPGLTWRQLEDLQATGLCTIGNHTHSHARPEVVDEAELDRCSAELERHLGVVPEHFAYTWGIPVPHLEPALRARFRSSATGLLGRNRPGDDPHRLRRIPVRGSDPLPFFEAKLGGPLLAERSYETIVRVAKRVGLRA